MTDGWGIFVTRINVTGPYWKVSIDSSCSLVLSCSRPLPKLMLTRIYVAIYVTVSRWGDTCSDGPPAYIKTHFKSGYTGTEQRLLFVPWALALYVGICQATYPAFLWHDIFSVISPWINYLSTLTDFDAGLYSNDKFINRLPISWPVQHHDLMTGKVFSRWCPFMRGIHGWNSIGADNLRLMSP